MEEEEEDRRMIKLVPHADDDDEFAEFISVRAAQILSHSLTRLTSVSRGSKKANHAPKYLHISPTIKFTVLPSITHFWTIDVDVFIYELKLHGCMADERDANGRREVKMCANILKIRTIIPNDKYININYNPDKTFNLFPCQALYFFTFYLFVIP